MLESATTIGRRRSAREETQGFATSLRFFEIFLVKRFTPRRMVLFDRLDVPDYMLCYANIMKGWVCGGERGFQPE